MFKKLIIGTAIFTLTACGAQNSKAADQAKPKAEKATQAATSAAPAKDITTEKLSDGMYMLLGPGGNIGVSVGEDGVFVIDDKFARFADQIISQIKGITDQPIRYVVNTHYHGDHTGANAHMKAAGATVMAHDNVRKRMGMTFENKAFGRVTKATNPSLWPNLTFSDQLHFISMDKRFQSFIRPMRIRMAIVLSILSRPIFFIWAIIFLMGCFHILILICLLYTSPSPRDRTRSRMPSSA